jgi:hypothetical protein
VADAQTIRRDSVAVRAQAARNRWIARKETLRAHRAVERAREVCYAPLIWLGSDDLETLERVLEPRLTLVPEPDDPDAA